MTSLCALATLAVIPFVQADAQVWWMAVPLIIDGFAWGAAFSILVAMLMADIPRELSGVAGGTQTAARLLAGAVGGAILTTILLGSVSVSMQEVNESDLTAQEQTEITQLYSFSAQIHPPTTDSGDTIEQKNQIEAFEQVIESTEESMAEGVRLGILAAAVMAFLGFLCGLKLEKPEAVPASADSVPSQG